MSFDEKQNLDNDEIDLGESFRSIWSHKFSLLLVITLSIPVSLMYSTTLNPTYTAETIFEKPQNEGTRDKSALGDVENIGFLSFLGGANLGSSNSFYSEIRSSSFLKTVLFNNPKLDTKTVLKFCSLPTKKDYGFSLRSLLIQLGVSENKNPSENQKTSLLVKCVNKMLTIEPDSYGSIESSAYRMSITSADPVFSATLANQIVEKYFVRHEESRDQNFQNVKKYLSQVITDAQLEFTEANKLLQSFKIKNSLLMNINPTSIQGAVPRLANGQVFIESPFEPELNEEIASLSQLEKSLNQVKQARLSLLSLNEPAQENIKAFLESTAVLGVFSRTFITAISRINDFSITTKEINQEIKKIVSEELVRLKQQTKAIEHSIDRRKAQTMQLMTIENRFQEMAIDVAKKKLIFEGLKDQLKEKILSTGLANVDQPVLLTKAVPPFRKASPDHKLIIILGVVLSIVVGIGYILIRQLYSKRIYSLSQLQNIGKSLSCYSIKYKQFMLMSERSDQTLISHSFFSRAKEAGSLGCIIDLSEKTKNNSLALTFFKTIASFLASDDTKIVYIDTLKNKKFFSTNSETNFMSDQKVLGAQGVLNKHVYTLNDEEGMINDGNIEQIKSKYSRYDKIICALGSEVGDLIKFKFIEQCDFYILIGRSLQFDEYTYKKFVHTNLEKEKKCLGVFLVD